MRFWTYRLPVAEHDWQVEVFPLAANRWVAVIDAPNGPFTTSAERPEDVEGEVVAAILEVTGVGDSSIRLIDSEGQPWTLARAAGQVRALLG